MNISLPSYHAFISLQSASILQPPESRCDRDNLCNCLALLVSLSESLRDVAEPSCLPQSPHSAASKPTRQAPRRRLRRSRQDRETSTAAVHARVSGPSSA